MKLDDVRGFEYVEVKHQRVANDEEWVLIYDRASGSVQASLIPIAPCVRCGRLTEDRTRDAYGDPMPEHLFGPEEDKEAVCSVCRVQDISEALEEDLMLMLEKKLGLAERNRDALKSFIETIFTDPQKILQVQDLDNRVRSLQTQVNVLWTAVGGAIITLFVLIVTMIATR